MSIQSGELTHSSSTHSQINPSYGNEKKQHTYYELSGSSGWHKNNSKSKNKSISKSKIVYPAKRLTHKKPNRLSPLDYTHFCRVLAYCAAITICVTLMTISRKIQNQTVTSYKGEHLRFTHQWIQTWFYFLSKTLLIILIITPYYNNSVGISQTFHSQLLITNKANAIATQYSTTSCQSFMRQQLVHCVSSICLMFAQFLFNIALYYMPASIWFIMTSITMIYISIFKFFRIEPTIMVFIGVFCIITGNIMLMSTETHELKKIADYNVITTAFAFTSLCSAALFQTIYFMIYSHYYDEYRTYCSLLIKQKTLRKSRYHMFHERDFLLKYDLERICITFPEWNHYKMLYMEGIYGLIFTTVIIAVLTLFDVAFTDFWIAHWFHVNIYSFVHCMMSNGVHIAMFIVYMASVMCHDIVMEVSKSYLSSFHCKVIFVITAIVIWCTDSCIHRIFTPHVDTMTDLDAQYYGERITWYSLLEAGAFLFVVFGICLFDRKHVAYLNGMIEHNGLIVKQQRIHLLTNYWKKIYYKKEKERLCGFSPKHLRRPSTDNEDDDEDEEQNIKSILVTSNNRVMNIEEQEESSFNYKDLSINSMNRDGTKLEGTINLLIGDGVSSALTHGPSKYYPALYT